MFYIEIKHVLILGGVSIPPKSGVDHYNKHCESIISVMDFFPLTTLKIFGDYNLPNVISHKELHGVCVSCHDDSTTLLVAKTFLFLGWLQIISIPNKCI